MIKIPISRVKGLVINMNVGNRLLLVKYKERRKMELSENMLGNGRYVVKFGLNNISMSVIIGKKGI